MMGVIEMAIKLTQHFVHEWVSQQQSFQICLKEIVMDMINTKQPASTSVIVQEEDNQMFVLLNLAASTTILQ